MNNTSVSSMKQILSSTCEQYYRFKCWKFFLPILYEWLKLRRKMNLIQFDPLTLVIRVFRIFRKLTIQYSERQDNLIFVKRFHNNRRPSSWILTSSIKLLRFLSKASLADKISFWAVIWQVLLTRSVKAELLFWSRIWGSSNSTICPAFRTWEKKVINWKKCISVDEIIRTHKNSIEIDNRIQTMSNGDNGTVCKLCSNSLLDQAVSKLIHICSHLIDH